MKQLCLDWPESTALGYGAIELHHSDETLVEHLFKGRDAAINLIDTLPLASLSPASKTRIISPPNVAAMYYLQIVRPLPTGVQSEVTLHRPHASPVHGTNPAKLASLASRCAKNGQDLREENQTG
ncbi:MAG: hypothetical protein QGH37_14555 [Candidatus Poribacteria bacterium]|nr:hypothetical protein [Candidatus Poribacteria bacterium]